MITLKQKVYNYLEPLDDNTSIEKFFNYFILALILLNTIAVFIDTVEWIYTPYKIYFEIIEYVSVVIFSIELILRIWSINIVPKYSHPIYGRIKYIFSFYCLVDILAIFPFYFPVFISVDLRFLRLLRISRFVRIIKLGRYSKGLQTIVNVWKIKRGELIASTTVALVFIVISACIVYLAENEAQPDKYTSIPGSIYWFAITISSFGDGDIYPITFIGRIFTVIIALIGVGLIALPSGIFASGFFEEHTKSTSKYCPHCGKKI